MFAVWLCGPTDCFLHALFREEKPAVTWAEANQGPEGYMIKRLSLPIQLMLNWEDELVAE